MQDVIEFGTILKFVRKSRRITQEALADSCGLDRTYIGLLERGKRSPTMETLCKLSVGLDILPSVLLGYWEDTLAMKWRAQLHSVIRNAIAQAKKENPETSQVPLEEPAPKEALSEDTLNYAAPEKNPLFFKEYVHSSQYSGQHSYLVDEPTQTDNVSFHNISTVIDKAILLGLLKTKVRKNGYDKSTVFEGIRSVLTLVLADEALGLNAAQNQNIAQSIIDIVEKIYDHNDGDILKTGMGSE
ncbi:MAG: helix-turn-helix domain-containing protein [Peptococcaceae bacterium]|nr:helix-turn-helix domain-containing protein [Peptococcaceae bacterium]